MTRGRQGDPTDDAALLALFDLLGQRWALRVLWELRGSPLTYRGLADRVPEMSTGTLTYRLRDLRAANLVDHAGQGYELSSSGRELVDHLEELRDWARRANLPNRSAGQG